uniref:Uncharacterized protein n=1 Tax=Ixodes ricinus TaxID=34613 RepID=A0A0K8RKF4_IXORI
MLGTCLSKQMLSKKKSLLSNCNVHIECLNPSRLSCPQEAEGNCYSTPVFEGRQAAVASRTNVRPRVVPQRCEQIRTEINSVFLRMHGCTVRTLMMQGNITILKITLQAMTVEVA